MGAGNVAAVYTRWRELADVPFRVLVYMALIAHDKHNPPKYFGGHRRLAEVALGREDPDTTASRKAVKRAVDALLGAGAITWENAGRTRHGTNASYVLNLSLGTRSPGPNRDPLTGTQPTPSPDAQRDPEGPAHREASGSRSAVIQGPAHRVPKEVREEEPQEPVAGTTPGNGTTISRCFGCGGPTTIDGDCVGGCGRQATA